MRILVAAGSSGGHIFPAIALLEELKNSGQEVLLVLPQKSCKDDIAVAAGRIKYIPAGFLSFNLSSQSLLGLYFFLRGFWESLLTVIKFKPEVVVGFGSLNTIAVIFWAWLFRIKTIIHEQNVICGRANRLLSKLADRVAISFSQTRANLNISGGRIVLTGNPLRKGMERLDKKEALDFFKFKAGKFTILITGGSRGSHRLNAACWEALAAYPGKDNLQIIHICGKQDFSWLAAGYAALNLTYKLFDFFPRMQYAYSAADLVVCRAGATTIAELGRFKLPAILVPYPFAYAHQSANAQVLEELKAALIIYDQDLTAEILKAKFTEFLADPQKLEFMRQAYPQVKKQDAVQLLVKEVLTAG
jgi:UDP-N-acetylglucosamine--N-acetylmuramyl-(pentapeptide) pyrophosphoryl-undecaprenol N-acetylglucosamine transferase